MLWWSGSRVVDRRRGRVAVVAATALLGGLLVATPAAADDPAPVTLAAFEGAEPFAAPPNAGIFTLGSDADDLPGRLVDQFRHRVVLTTIETLSRGAGRGAIGSLTVRMPRS